MKRELLQILGEENVKFFEPLKNHCTFRIGGPAMAFATPTNFTDLFEVLRLASEYGKRYKIVGNASNILFSDCGFDGVVVCTKKINSFCKLDESRIVASAGMSLAELGKFATDEGLSGLEFSSGIPATVGGAICMNAGAYGGEISSVLNSVTFLCEGKVVTKKRDEIAWGYRTSEFLGSQNIVLFAEFQLKKDLPDEIKKRVQENLKIRNSSQPKGFSAGCIFKKTGGESAGKLIDQAGLKNKRKNGAVVSNTHANFIINENNATASDVCLLIEEIQEVVLSKFDVRLETEIEIVR